MTSNESTSRADRRDCPGCGYAIGPFDEKCPRCGYDLAKGTPAPPAAPGQPAAPPPPIPTPPRAPVQFNNAGFWIRVAAALIDGVILAVPGAVIFFAFGVSIGELQDLQAQTMASRVANFVSIGIGLLYYVIMNGTWGATVGKMAVRIKIVRADGSPIGYIIALARYIVAGILGACTCALMYLSVAFNAEHRGWHDQIVGTRVIYTR